MEKFLAKILQGHKEFHEKYVNGNDAIMQQLSDFGQQPQMMVVSCCDSRVDPALILQCDPGDLFVVRNVANIVPTYEKDEFHHGTSAALEFGICYLNVKHLVILGHSQCGGIQALMKSESLSQNDFIGNWVALIDKPASGDVDECSQKALLQSYQHALTFPWIKERVENGTLLMHLWFFNIKEGEIYQYSNSDDAFIPLV